MKHLTIIILALAANVASAESITCVNVGLPQQRCFPAQNMETAIKVAINETARQQVMYMQHPPVIRQASVTEHKAYAENETNQMDGLLEGVQ